MIHKLRPGTRWAMASSLSFFFWLVVWNML
jgi:hypothetical protein